MYQPTVSLDKGCCEYRNSAWDEKITQLIGEDLHHTGLFGECVVYICFECPGKLVLNRWVKIAFGIDQYHYCYE